MKRIAILCAGSRGDIYPYVALGCAIQDLGCAVRLLTFDPFRELVTGLGLEFYPLSDPLEALKESNDWDCWQSSSASLPQKLLALRRLIRLSHQPFVRMLEESVEGCSQSEALIAATSGFAAPHIAEKLGLPFCRALLQPETATRLFPHYMSPWTRSLGGFLNHATYSVAELGFKALFGNAIAAWRKESLHLPRASASGALSRAPVVYGFSRHVVAKPPDWNEHTHISGYWFLQPDKEWEPPDELAGFLAEGAPPLVVCLNSIRGGEDFLRIVVAATLKMNQRAVIICDQEISEVGRLSDSIFTIEFAPHHWLFRRAAAVIHHGGTGTAAAALRAQRPSIIVPSFFDQSFWANAMHRLGVASAPLAAHNVSVETMAEAIAEVISQPRYRERAASVGSLVAEEDGAASSARLLLQLLQ